MYQKNGRWYADFRDYGDVGGKREALLDPHNVHGRRLATTSHSIAARVMSDRLEELENLRLSRKTPVDTNLRAYASRHLELKAQSRG